MLVYKEHTTGGWDGRTATKGSHPEVAARAGVSLTWYGWLEMGRDAGRETLFMHLREGYSRAT